MTNNLIIKTQHSIKSKAPKTQKAADERQKDNKTNDKQIAFLLPLLLFLSILFVCLFGLFASVKMAWFVIPCVVCHLPSGWLCGLALFVHLCLRLRCIQWCSC